MKITYENTVEDILSFKIDILKNDSVLQKKIRLMQIFVPIIIMVIYFVSSYKDKIILICIILSCLSWIIYYPIIFQWKAKKAITKKINDSKNDNAFTYQSLTLTEEGIIKEQEGETLKISWKNIEKLDIKESYIYLYTNALTAFIIPISAFKDEDEKKEFLGILHKHMN